MSKVAIVTDSNSGITQSEAKEYGVTVMPMPFFINDQTYYEMPIFPLPCLLSEM